MQNKKMLRMMAGLCCTILVLGGCSSSKTNQKQESSMENNSVTETTPEANQEQNEIEPVMINYSFLYDDATRQEIREIMKTDGVGEKEIDDFMATVTQFADTMGEMKGAHEGFTTTDATKSFYDPDYIGTNFMQKLSFDDQNCRLTAYSIFKQFYTVSEDSGFKYDNDSLYGDLEILKLNKNLNFTNEDKRKYTALFSDVNTEKTMDVAVHAQNVKDTWAKRGIIFSNEDKVQLASVMMNDPSVNTIFAGHAGVVFQTEEGYLLIEKLAQYTPFVAAKFENYEDLNTYLLSEVKDFKQDGAAEPFVMLNDKLL